MNGLTLITNTGIDKMQTEYIVIKTEEGDRVVGGPIRPHKVDTVKGARLRDSMAQKRIDIHAAGT